MTAPTSVEATPARRPVPAPDSQSEPFWAAAARHQLTLARCARCGRFTHPPEAVCPLCGSTDPGFRFEPVSGRGQVRSWTVVRQSFLPGFEVPFLLVDVELADQADLRLIGRLLDGADVPLRIGDEVTVVFEDVADGVAIPAFQLAGAR
ncbi:Zn-ribbon domain-containing OB-fold protein [Pseudofrankia inefficax]|uniref:DUF35 domain-containing protein n=1 Tax=Pseudofrankia inefficax (strain DSM 45817 / CECT 9037 / DDB 130130 / EuI1c) TaxID=298654 RepID=E3IUA2_PSEI1|nr:OB-fold domain-containing protein [Pseudofrankia inefficax]ADP82439.1 protein of unknown function DUF35 [Pseudofrankia inefficax]